MTRIWVWCRGHVIFWSNHAIILLPLLSVCCRSPNPAPLPLILSSSLFAFFTAQISPPKALTILFPQIPSWTFYWIATLLLWNPTASPAYPLLSLDLSNTSFNRLRGTAASIRQSCTCNKTITSYKNTISTQYNIELRNRRMIQTRQTFFFSNKRKTEENRKADILGNLLLRSQVNHPRLTPNPLRTISRNHKNKGDHRSTENQKIAILIVHKNQVTAQASSNVSVNQQEN